MIMSAETENTIHTTAKQVPKEIWKSICNTSVKLAGLTAKDEFTAAGVILYANLKTKETYLLSAMHNLSIFAGHESHPSMPPEDLIKRFIEKVSIYYDDNMVFNKSPKRKACIHEIQCMRSVGSKDWQYDVILLKSKDPNLFEFARQNYIYVQGTFNKELLYNPKNYLSRGTKDKQTWFIQTGFGHVKETVELGPVKKSLPTAKVIGKNIEGALQYRFTKPLSNRTWTCFEEGEQPPFLEVHMAIQIEADPNNSSAPGDSGGPLFIVTNDKGWYCNVIGVTYGSDLSVEKEKCAPDNELRVNDISTSLEPCYREGKI